MQAWVHPFKVVGPIIRVAILGVGLGIAISVVILILRFSEPLMALWAGRTTVTVTEVSLGKTELTKEYTYARKDIALRVRGDEFQVFGLLKTEARFLTTARCTAGINYASSPFQVARRTADTVHLLIPRPTLFGCTMIEPGEIVGGGVFMPSPDLINSLQARAFQEARDRISADREFLPQAEKQALSEAELDMRRLGFREVQTEFLPETSRPAPVLTPAPKTNR